MAADRKHIFTTIKEIQKFYPFQDNEDFFEALLPTLRQVERKYLLHVIDEGTWATLLRELDQPDFSDPKWEALAERAQHAAAHLTALYHIAKANVVYSGSGLLVQRSEQMGPASESRTKDLKRALFRDSQDALDQLLEFLEAHTDDFSEWASSPQRVDISGLLIPTGAEFSNFYEIGAGRWLFRLLVPSQRHVIATEVKAHLGKAYLDEVLEELKGTPGEETLAILPALRTAVANLTMAHALPRIQLQFGPEGVAMFDTEFQVPDARRQETDHTRLKYLQDDATSRGLTALTGLKYFLNENASAEKYQTYFTSSAYYDPTKDVTDLNDYDEPQNHWAL